MGSQLPVAPVQVRFAALPVSFTRRIFDGAVLSMLNVVRPNVAVPLEVVMLGRVPLIEPAVTTSKLVAVGAAVPPKPTCKVPPVKSGCTRYIHFIASAVRTELSGQGASVQAEAAHVERADTAGAAAAWRNGARSRADCSQRAATLQCIAIGKIQPTGDRSIDDDSLIIGQRDTTRDGGRIQRCTAGNGDRRRCSPEPNGAAAPNVNAVPVPLAVTV